MIISKNVIYTNLDKITLKADVVEMNIRNKRYKNFYVRNKKK